MNGAQAYGLWGLVILNSVVFILFALSFAPPQSARGWRTFGAFSAFLVALFTEMYGYPLTIYLLMPWLATAFPGIDLLSHEAGHLTDLLAGWGGDMHFGPFHLAGNLLILLGFLLLGRSWAVLYRAQRRQELATTGPYAHIRHPQYAGFIAIMCGFLLQWPTLVTLLMFPVLVALYVRLARQEERDALARFGEAYLHYMQQVPAFFPRMAVGGRAGPKHEAGHG